MDLRQLRYFVAVAEAPSIAKAADWLRITQPALSVQLSQIEAELGLQLVVRSNRGIELTEHGQVLYKHAASMLDAHREAMASLKRDAGQPFGRVSLGLPSSLATVIAPDLYRGMRSALPGVELYILESSTAALFDWLQTGKIDMAVLFNVPDDVGFQVTPLYSEAFCLIGLPQKGVPDSVQFDELANYPLILPSKATSWRKLLDGAASDSSWEIHAPIETESVNVLKHVALSGEAFAVMPRLSAQSEIDSGLLQARRIVNPEMCGTKALVTLKSQLLSPVQKRVRELVVDLTTARARHAGLDIGNGAVQPLRRILPSAPFPIVGVRAQCG
jgi:LysR family nitrogen assimilation transcriptional regulator